MNILHSTTFLQGGAGRVVYDLAVAQQGAGHAVTVVCAKTPEPGYWSYPEYVDGLRERGIDVYEVDSTFKRDVYLICLAVDVARKVMVAHSVDLVHAHAAIPALVGLIARGGSARYVPVVQTMHGWGINKTPEQEKTDVIIMNGLDEVVAVSETARGLLEGKGVDSRRIRVVYNGLGEEPKDAETDDDVVAAELREARRAGRKVVGCIGTVGRRKNQALLLEAVGRMVPEADLFVAFVGEGEAIPRLQARAVELGLGDCVRFYGYRAAASRYFRYFDCLVLPSLSEGLPVAVIEAFRERVPVVASNIPELAEVVVEGKTGFLFDPGDLVSLVRCLRRVLFTAWRQNIHVVAGAYRIYRSRFSLEAMVSGYESCYRELLAQRGSAHC